MFYYIIVLTLGLFTITTAKPSASLTYGSSPAYTTAGSSQIELRNNYNTGSGYSNSIGYASPLTARIVSPMMPQLAYSAPAVRYSSSILAAPFGYNAPSVAARYESPFVGAGYASPYTATYATPYAASYTPFAPNLAPAFTTAYGSPYTISAHGAAPVFV